MGVRFVFWSLGGGGLMEECEYGGRKEKRVGNALKSDKKSR